MHYNYLTTGGAISLTLGGEGELVHFSGFFYMATQVGLDQPVCSRAQTCNFYSGMLGICPA